MEEYLEYVKDKINDILLKVVVNEDIKVVFNFVTEDWYDIKISNVWELSMIEIDKVNALISENTLIKNWQIGCLSSYMRKNEVFYYLLNAKVKIDCIDYLMHVRSDKLKDLI